MREPMSSHMRLHRRFLTAPTLGRGINERHTRALSRMRVASSMLCTGARVRPAMVGQQLWSMMEIPVASALIKRTTQEAPGRSMPSACASLRAPRIRRSSIRGIERRDGGDSLRSKHRSPTRPPSP